MTHAMTRYAAAGMAGILMLAQPASAQAINQPSVDASVAPPAGTAGPVIPLEKRGACDVTGLIAGTDVAAPPPGARLLNLPGAWEFSRGSGQTVAVLDTGVQPGPRLPRVAPGGDYVADTDGLTDCDGHGTLVAGLIAGLPGADGFSGVAPDARVLSIRLTSDKFAPRSLGPDAAAVRAQAGVSALARAVVRAADLGAGVIDISAATCVPADSRIDQSALGAALRHAAVEKNAVIVAAAGNLGPTAGGVDGGAACQSNPGGWSSVSAVSLPSSWQPYVLSVGSVTDGGQPSDFTAAGPWLGIAAPGENVLSLGNGAGGLANGVPNAKGELGHVSGTSFAAAYVAGVAALVRSRYPQLTATEVVQRLTATAHRGARAPSNQVGAGTVDPVAALTWQLPQHRAQPPTDHPIAAPVAAAPENHTTRNAAFAGALVLLALAALVIVAVNRREEPNK